LPFLLVQSYALTVGVTLYFLISTIRHVRK